MEGASGQVTEGIHMQTEEIEEVKGEFSGRVKVITHVGEFTHVVTVQPVTDIDCHLKFQLTEKYPSEVPVLSVRSVTLSQEQKETLTSQLLLFMNENTGHSMISSLVGSCALWLKENNISTDLKTQGQEKSKKSKSKYAAKSKPGKKPVLEMEDMFVKKPSMKTAADVIKRLQWDESVNKDDFIVGYMDRIVGLVEKRFTAFTWEDLASVDYMSLAIPQHRIQYFKYKSDKVWDKNERLDNVFGSAGNKISLIEAMQKIDSKESENTESDNANGTNDNENRKNDSNKDTDSRGENLTLTSTGVSNLGGEASGEVNVVEEHVNAFNMEKADGQLERQEMAGKGPGRYNFFVALHITDEELVNQLVQAQDEIARWYPAYEAYKTPRNGFHLTLAVMAINSVEEERACIEALDRSKRMLSSLAADCGTLIFSGIGSFSPKVIFTHVKYSGVFRELIEAIRQSLRQAGVTIEERPFNPHLTIFNVKKSMVKTLDLPKRLECGSLTGKEFGTQDVNNIQACKMGPVECVPSEFCYESIWLWHK